MACVTAAGLAVVLTAPHRGKAVPVRFADAQDDVAVVRGAAVYSGHCGFCHGRRLEGQALWQVEDADQHRRAPALDQTGNAWQHSDAVLYRIVSAGQAPAMPGYAARLSEADRWAVLAYVKSYWPIAMQAAQAAFNPGQAGMPQARAGESWSFAAFCRQKWVGN